MKTKKSRINLSKVWKHFPNSCKATSDSGSYCVMGALMHYSRRYLHLDMDDFNNDNFPGETDSANLLVQLNPKLKNKARAYAEKIICLNDDGHINGAKNVIKSALTYNKND